MSERPDKAVSTIEFRDALAKRIVEDFDIASQGVGGPKLRAEIVTRARAAADTFATIYNIETERDCRHRDVVRALDRLGSLGERVAFALETRRSTSKRRKRAR